MPFLNQQEPEPSLLLYLTGRGKIERGGPSNILAPCHKALYSEISTLNWIQKLLRASAVHKTTWNTIIAYATVFWNKGSFFMFFKGSAVYNTLQLWNLKVTKAKLTVCNAFSSRKGTGLEHNRKLCKCPPCHGCHCSSKENHETRKILKLFIRLVWMLQLSRTKDG